MNRKPLEPLVKQIVAAHDIDVVVLAEMHSAPFAMAATLSEKSGRRPFHHTPPAEYEKVHVFARFDPSLVIPVYDTGRMTVRHFVLPGRDSVVVAGVHLGSKMYLRDDQQAARCVDLSLQLAKQETKVGHTRTILVGDFNVNPFEHGVAGAPGFNAVMTRAIASRGSRAVDAKKHPFFYNPMWNHFGDGGPNPPGTYYYCSTRCWCGQRC